MPGRASGSAQKLGGGGGGGGRKRGFAFIPPQGWNKIAAGILPSTWKETLFCIYENATVLLFFSRTQFPRGRERKKRDAQKVFFSPSFSSSPPPRFDGRVSQALLILPKEKREAEFDLQEEEEERKREKKTTIRLLEHTPT